MSGARCCCGGGDPGPTSCAEIDYCNTEPCYEIDIQTFRKLHVLAGYAAASGSLDAFDAAGNQIAAGTPLWWAYLDLDVRISGTVCYRGRDAWVGTSVLVVNNKGAGCISDPCDDPAVIPPGQFDTRRVWGSGPCPTTVDDGCADYSCDPLDSTVSMTINATRRLEVLLDHRRGSPTSTLFTAGVETATIDRTIPAEARMRCHALQSNSPGVCDYSGAPAFLLNVAPYWLDSEVPIPPIGSPQFCTVDTAADAWLDWPTPTQSAAWVSGNAQNIAQFKSPTIDMVADRPRWLPFLFPFNPTKLNLVGKIDTDPSAGVTCKSWEGTYNGTPPTTHPLSVAAALATYPSDWNSSTSNVYVSVRQFGTPATISLAVCP